MKPTIKDLELDTNHLIIKDFPLSPTATDLLYKRDWKLLDQFFLEAEKCGGELFIFLAQYLDFKKIEHIIAIRSANGDHPDEDGIWHDDGSRILGFSLSLTKSPENVTGGHLRFKAKTSDEYQSIPTQKMGKMILFKTGVYGFEHMVTAVTQGERIIIAGWCS